MTTRPRTDRANPLESGVGTLHAPSAAETADRENSARTGWIARNADRIAPGAFFGLYLWQMAPALQWGDPAKILRQAFESDVNMTSGGGHGLLIAMIHFLDGILPGGIELAARMTGPIFATLALFLVSSVLRHAHVARDARLAAILALGVSHLFWTTAEIIESYALLGFCFLAWVRVAQWTADRPTILRSAALLTVGGTSILNHQLFLLVVAAGFCTFALEFRGRARWNWIGVHVALALCAGVAALIRPEAMQAFLESTVYHVVRWVTPTEAPRQLVLLGAALAFQFPGLMFIAGFTGFAASWRNPERRVLTQLLTGAALFVGLFALSYGFARAVYLMLPCYIIFALFAAMGWERHIAPRLRGPVIRRVAIASVAALPIIGYASLWRVCNATETFPISSREFAHRDTNRYYIWPGKAGEVGPQRFADEVFGHCGAKGIVFADFRIASVLHQAARSEPDDVTVFDTDQLAFHEDDKTRAMLRAAIDAAHVEGRTVIIADRKSTEFYTRSRHLLDLFPELEQHYAITPRGFAFEVAPK